MKKFLVPAVMILSLPTFAQSAPLSDSDLEIASALIANSDKIPQVPAFFTTTFGDVKCLSGGFKDGVLETEFTFEIHDAQVSTPISFSAPVEGALDIIPPGAGDMCPADPQFLRSGEAHLLDALMRSKSALDLARAAGFSEIISADGTDTLDGRDYRIEIGEDVCGGLNCVTNDRGTISISVTFLPPTATEHVVSHFTPKGSK
jgi:hypothetical protein